MRFWEGLLADVLISFSHLDRDRVAAIAERMASLGYSTYWDRQHAGDANPAETEHQLADARAVLTVWSHNGRNSTWVYAQSGYALEHGKLLQLRLDRAHLPAPFNAVAVADVSSERGDWGPLEDALVRLVRHGQAPTPPDTQNLGLFATPATAGTPKLLAFATASTLMAYAGVLSAAANDALPPDQMQIALSVMVAVAMICAALTAIRMFALSRAGS